VQRLLGIKPIYTFTRYAWIAFFLLTFWTTFAPLVLVLQILMENLFKVFLQIVKGTWIRFQEAFSRFEIFSPCFKCFSFDYNKTPPGWNSPLSVQEGFTNMKKDLDTNWKKFFSKYINLKYGYQLKILFWKFWNWWWCGPFALGYILSPFGINRQKRSRLRALYLLSPHLY
jgi:hypothetical protein